MIKKTLFFIKLILVTLIWSFIYLTTLRFVFSYLWNFDIFYVEYWKIISDFWNAGGIIKTGKDFSLIFMIFISIPLWIVGLILLVKFKYSRIITSIVNFSDRMALKNYDPNDARLVIKNLSTKAEKVSIDDMINAKIKQMKNEKEADKDLEATKIRTKIQDKIKNKK